MRAKERERERMKGRICRENEGAKNETTRAHVSVNITAGGKESRERERQGRRRNKRGRKFYPRDSTETRARARSALATRFIMRSRKGAFMYARVCTHIRVLHGATSIS